MMKVSTYVLAALGYPNLRYCGRRIRDCVLGGVRSRIPTYHVRWNEPDRARSFLRFASVYQG